MLWFRAVNERGQVTGGVCAIAGILNTLQQIVALLAGAGFARVSAEVPSDDGQPKA